MKRLDILEKAMFNVKFKSKNYIVEEKGINYDRASMLANKAMTENVDDIEFCWQLDKCIAGFGFVGYNSGDITITISAYLPVVDTGEVHTCPRRSEGPWFNDKNVDKWELRGEDKCCSYCGSLHPDRVIDLIKQLGPSIFGSTTKSYKGYITRSSVPNAGFGGIKFYTQHFDKIQLDKLNSLIAGNK